MFYGQAINGVHKGLFVFLLDQSRSMSGELKGSSNRRMHLAATLTNAFIQNLCIQSTHADGYHDIADVAVLGYHTAGQGQVVVQSALAGPLAERELWSVRDLGEHPLRMDKKRHVIFDDETGAEMVTYADTPTWIMPRSLGDAPLNSALQRAAEIVEPWIAEHPQSFPPVVVLITGGENCEPDSPLPYTQYLRSLATKDGQTLVLVQYIAVGSEPQHFPSQFEALSNDAARTLFLASSPLPSLILRRARREGFHVRPGTRTMTINEDLASFLKFLEWGTHGCEYSEIRRLLGYQQAIAVNRKGLFLFLIDQSAVMSEDWAGTGQTRMQTAAEITNDFIQNLGVKATRANGIADMLDVAVLGYRTTGHGEEVLESAFHGDLADPEIQSICQVSAQPLRMAPHTYRFLDEDTNEVIETEIKAPVWIEPAAEGQAPLGSALRRVREIVEGWIQEHPQSFPPIVILITSGENNEPVWPLADAERLKSLATDDGEVLLLVRYLAAEPVGPPMFPHRCTEITDDAGQRLLHVASVLPPLLYMRAEENELAPKPGARSMILSGDLKELFRLLEFACD
jgi:uncharacterized protein YegL